MRALRWIGAAGLVCGCACTQAPPETPEPIFFADVESISLGYETRHAIAVAAASSKTFRVHVPANGSLRFAIATAEPDEAVMFRALVDGNPVFEKILAKEDGDHWWDQPRVDLEPWSGESVDITFETDGRALWGSPVIETEDAPPFGPNLIVISIDCLRADHVGAYGYEKPTTPAIDAFAEDAVVFEEASSTSSWTIPAHMSMFTGLPPLMHGVSESPDDYWAGRAKTLAPTVPYLAELLARRGYETAGVVSSVPMSPRYGFDRGFRVYRVHAAKAEEVVDSSLDLVARSGERPFFLFVHFIDPHWSYLPMVEFGSYAEEFIARFGERPEDISGLIARHNGKALGARPEDAEDVRTLYDAAVAYVDRELGRLFAELTERGLYQDAFILLIGDHGEAFYDHETFGHAKTLYRELTHVPLIVKWPGEASKGREDTPVSQVDVFPTVLEAAGITPPPMEGTSLRRPPAARGLVLDASWEDRFRRETMLAVRQGDLKYIAYLPLLPVEKLSLDKVLREELFDLARDPTESENLLDALHPADELAPFRERLAAYIETAKVYRSEHEGSTITIDEDVRRSLEALGYVTR